MPDIWAGKRILVCQLFAKAGFTSNDHRLVHPHLQTCIEISLVALARPMLAGWQCNQGATGQAAGNDDGASHF
ncbi:hypothetical protein [Leeia oryzae]|uniref:hypothetical protein n=1 Tax=Leeia oryzae TaxID=356662 RepID=UPI0003736290|nr:hypothetical protein [Leeia oryzae]